MGGSDYETAGAQRPLEVLGSYSQYLPNMLRLTADQMPNTAMRTLEAANQTVNPGSSETLGYNALNLDQLQRYALPQAQVGQQVANSNALAGAQTNLSQLTGPGGDAARAASALNRETNPNYYTAQDAASRGAASAVNAINLNGLSPGEANAIERSLNQTNAGNGNLGLVNPMNTISNAMNFGGAYNNKINLMNNAVGAATNAANSASGNGGFNGVNVALGQPNVSTQSNFGSGQFANTNSQSANSNANNTLGFGSSLLGSMTSANAAAQSAGASMANATSPSSYLGAVCCFIFLEAYHGKLPKCVRRGRDKYYFVNPDIAAGYRRMAKWLVPLMQDNEIVRNIVWKLMVNPITKHLEHPKKGWNKSVTHFWLKTWAITGKNRLDNEYAMPWQYV